MKKIVVKEIESGVRLNKYIAHVLVEAPQSFIYKMLRKKNITLNSKKADGTEIVKAGDEVTFFLSDETFDSFASKRNETKNSVVSNKISPISENRIIYEDDNILIAFKKAGELSQKVDKNDVSINERILAYLEKTNSNGSDVSFKPGVCNRLDRNTPGLIIVGKNYKATVDVGNMLKKHTLDKYYLTVVTGKLDKTVDAKLYLGKDEANNKVYVSPVPKEGYVLTHSIFKPIKYTDKYTLVKVKLLTGKSHQIRASLNYLGHSIVGDPKYGLEEVNRLASKKYGINYQMLVAFELYFGEAEGILAGLKDESFSIDMPDSFVNFGKDAEIWPGKPEDLEVHF